MATAVKLIPADPNSTEFEKEKEPTAFCGSFVLLGRAIDPRNLPPENFHEHKRVDELGINRCPGQFPLGRIDLEKRIQFVRMCKLTIVCRQLNLDTGI
jgi:hypothetical protein